MWVKTLQIKNKCVSVNDALKSTTTNRLYNSIVPPGLTYLMTTHPLCFILSLGMNVNLVCRRNISNIPKKKKVNSIILV